MKDHLRCSFALLIFILSIHLCYSQVVTKTYAGSIPGAVCPGTSTEYTVSTPSGFTTCSITWSVTNGSISSQNGATCSVQWNDTPGATGTVTATFSNCGSANAANNEKTATLSELILSVKNQTWGPYGTSINLDYCTPQSVYLTVPPMYVTGTGFWEPVPQTEVKYVWTLPAGWVDQSTSLAVVTTSVNFITIVPTGCAKPGQVKVQGSLKDRCGSAELSSTATISLNGVNPVVTVGPQPGYTGGSACNTTPVTFYATTSVALGCINSYDWNYPSSWALVSQSGNSITLQPDGTPAISNPISATVQFGCGTSILSGSITPAYTAPVLTGPDIVCNSGTFSLQNASGVTWSSSNTSIATVNSSGVVTSVPNAGGELTITAAMPCSVPAVTKTIWVGKPSSPGAFNQSLNPMCVGQIKSVSFSEPKGWVSIDAYANTPNLNVASATNTMMIVEALAAGTGSVKYVSTNACGTKETNYNVSVRAQGSPGCNGISRMAISISPNPVSDEIVLINEDESNEEYQLMITDSDQKKWVQKTVNENHLRIPVNEFKSGVYFITIKTEKETTTKRIIIKQ